MNPSNFSSHHPHPFGMLTPGRNWSAGSEYRFGFNGKESDAETYGEGNIYDYGFRIYNPRLGKFLSVDPLTQSYPWYTPYQFAGNKPIVAIDLDGLEEYIVHYIYDEQGDLTKIRVTTYIDANKKSQDMEIHKNNPIFQDKKVAVIYTSSDGSSIKDPTFQDELTKSQANIIARKKNKVLNLSPSKMHRTDGAIFGGFYSKTFNSGTFIQGEIEMQYTLDIKFQGNSDKFLPQENDKINDLGITMQILEESSVDLYGNTGTASGNPNGEPLGGGNDVLNSSAILNGLSTDIKSLMTARADAVGKVLISDFNVDPKRIRSNPGVRTDNPSGRNVTSRLSLPESE